MRVDHVGHAVKLRRQVLNRRLNEENVSRPALRRFAVNLLGNLLHRGGLGVYSDVKPIRMSPGRLVNKAPVARPQVYDYAPPVGGDEVMECSSIESVESFATNHL